MRKRELAKAERRLKKNEVIEMSSIETKQLDDDDVTDHVTDEVTLFLIFSFG